MHQLTNKRNKIIIYLIFLIILSTISKKSLEFEEIFDRLAKKNRIPLYNFLLEGVAGDPTMNLSDGIHPNENGHQRIAEGMSGFVKNHLGSLLKTKEEI